MPAEVPDGAEGVRGVAPVGLAVRDLREAVGEAVDDEHVGLVDGVDDRPRRVALPAEDDPDRVRVRGEQRLLDALRRVGDRDVTRVAALVQQVHLVERRRAAEHLVLGTVEGRRDAREVLGARVQPVGAPESHPGALRDGARPFVPVGEARRDRAEVAREHGRHPQLPYPVGDSAPERGPGVEELPRHGIREGGEILHQPPRLVGGPRDPLPQLLVRVPEPTEHPVVERVRARVHEDLVVAVQRQHVELAFPVRPVVVRARVAVVRVVEGEAVRDAGLPRDRAGRARQVFREVELLARPADVRVGDVLQVPAQARELGGRGVAGDGDAAGFAGDPEGIRLACRLESQLPPVAGEEPPGRPRCRRCCRLRHGCLLGRGAVRVRGCVGTSDGTGRAGDGGEERATG